MLHLDMDLTKFVNNLSVTHLEFYLSVKDLENLDEMKLLQNLHLYTQKSVCVKRLKTIGEIGVEHI